MESWACGSRSANILLLPMTCHRLIHCSQLGYIAWTLARVDPSPSVRTTMCCTAIDMICIGVFHTFLCTRDSAAGPLLLCLIYHIYYFRWSSQERHLGEMNRQLKHKVLICSQWNTYTLLDCTLPWTSFLCIVVTTLCICCSILQLEAEGSSNYRTLQHAAAWPAPGGTMVEHDGATYHVHPPAPSAAMDCEPTLQIGYNLQL